MISQSFTKRLDRLVGISSIYAQGSLRSCAWVSQWKGGITTATLNGAKPPPDASILNYQQSSTAAGSLPLVQATLPPVPVHPIGAVVNDISAWHRFGGPKTAGAIQPFCPFARTHYGEHDVRTLISSPLWGFSRRQWLCLDLRTSEPPRQQGL